MGHIFTTGIANKAACLLFIICEHFLITASAKTITSICHGWHNVKNKYVIFDTIWRKEIIILMSYAKYSIRAVVIR